MQHWKTIFAVGFLILSVGFFVRMVSDANIALAETESTPPNAIPVYCDVGVGMGVTQTFICYRGDDRTPFNVVPADHYLLVTDIVVKRNTLTDSGDYLTIIGRKGDTIPVVPRVRLTGTHLQSDAFHFQAPPIILEGGESLSAHNDSSSDYFLDYIVSGFLVTDVTYQVLFQNYLPLTTR